jgi:hypothetical protein
MLLSLDDYKCQQFDEAAEKIMAEPQKYCEFNSVSDFYKAAWLKDFPQGTQVSATGLDDGAEEFYAVIAFKSQYLQIDVTDKTKFSFKNQQGNVFITLV